MNLRKTVLGAAVLSAVGGTTAFTPDSASAAVLADGVYNVFVNTTPVTTYGTGSGGTYTTYKFGTDGAWNSSFTYGNNTPGPYSLGFNDNGVSVDTGDSHGPHGTSVAGDGWAGVWQLSVADTNVSFLSFKEDAVRFTPVGDIVQYGTLTGGGTLDQNTGQLTITPTGRLNAASSFPAMTDIARNIDDLDCDANGCTTNGNTAWTPLTTLSASNEFAVINGAPITSLGDVDNDGLADYSAILVSGGQYGSAWAGAAGVPYLEVYNVRIEAAPVPLPPAIWLFGSGLAGFAALAKRRQTR